MERQGVDMQSWKTSIAAYYKEKTRQFGATPQGVDWNSKESQDLRFRQLLEVIPQDGLPVSINDYGCGYGALLHYILSNTNIRVSSYYGYDICREALQSWTKPKGKTKIELVNTSNIIHTADYSFTSGTFHVRLDIPEKEWRNLVLYQIDSMYKKSRRGLAFNCLTNRTDYKRSHLWYTDPEELLQYCKRLGGKTTLIQNYGLFDFTILIRK